MGYQRLERLGLEWEGEGRGGVSLCESARVVQQGGREDSDPDRRQLSGTSGRGSSNAEGGNGGDIGHACPEEEVVFEVEALVERRIAGIETGPGQGQTKMEGGWNESGPIAPRWEFRRAIRKAKRDCWNRFVQEAKGSEVWTTARYTAPRIVKAGQALPYYLT